MPDQRALLVWSNGVERLAIETRIVGEGTNFAWVVPLRSWPSVDSVRAAIRKVLRGHPELVSRPMIEEDSPRNYLVRAVPGDVELVYFNDHGQEQVYRIREFMAEGR